MKTRCPKCTAMANQNGERIDCPNCGYSSDDFIVRRRNLATHRVNNVSPDITKPLPSRKVNGSKEE